MEKCIYLQRPLGHQQYKNLIVLTFDKILIFNPI